MFYFQIEDYDDTNQFSNCWNKIVIRRTPDTPDKLFFPKIADIDVISSKQLSRRMYSRREDK